MYSFSYQDGELLCTAKKKIGFRRVLLIQDPFEDENEPGHSFVFEVNKIRIFCGGSIFSRYRPNYLLTNLTKDQTGYPVITSLQSEPDNS